MQALLTNSVAVLYNQTGRSEQALETYVEAAKLLDELLADQAHTLFSQVVEERESLVDSK